MSQSRTSKVAVCRLSRELSSAPLTSCTAPISLQGKVNLHLALTQAPYISRRDHNLKLSVPEATIDSYKFSFYPRTTRIWNQLPATAVTAQQSLLSGGRPSCHQRVRTSCRFQDAVNFRSMVFTRTSLVFTVNRTYTSTLFCCHSAPSPAVTAHPIPV